MHKQIVFVFALFFYSYISYSQDTLSEIKIKIKSKSLQKSSTLVANTTVLTSAELLKAACCNLAESFETNPSIDVNFSDALTGTKQIKMLGLSSPYLMITEENIPSVRGASQNYGLSFTPGTWVESIQITKGAGSVVNGYESISGQINSELIKPSNNIPFFMNYYVSSDSRSELNLHFNKKINQKWASSLFLHGNSRVLKTDMNNDGFLDNPLSKQINILNRWQYTDAKKGWVGFANFRYLNDSKQTGEWGFNPQKDKFSTQYWGSEINTERFDIATKIGFVFPNLPFQSIGFQNAVNSYNQQSYFGLSRYNIKQQSYYSNLIFNSIINNTMNKFTTGLNFTIDSYNELVKSTQYSRLDNNVGAFFEYTYDNLDNFSMILGGRVDNHNRMGFFITPRLHLRYNSWEKGVFRFSMGRGKRLANIFAENQSFFGSSRIFEIQNTNGNSYGLNPEIAWNYGFSFNQKFKLFNKNANFGMDYYVTNFKNQVVVDVFQSPQKVLFYNLNGKSFSKSLQLELNYELSKKIEIRTAYKWYDVQTTYNSGVFQKYLQAKQRVFANVAYESLLKNNAQWKFDVTYNWIGSQQLPTTFSNPEPDRLLRASKPYSLLNTQITRVFSEAFECYSGIENATNYKQTKVILGAENPFGTTFDTSIIYAPVFGRMFYAGLRYKIK